MAIWTRPQMPKWRKGPVPKHHIEEKQKGTLTSYELDVRVPFCF